MTPWYFNHCCFSVPDLSEWQLPSTNHLPRSSAFSLSDSFYFLTFFFPSELLLMTMLNLCPDKYLMLAWNLMHRKHLAVPLLYGAFFQRIISVSFCFVLAQSPEKVIWLTQDPCRSRSPISRCSWDPSDSCCIHLIWADWLGDVGIGQVCFFPSSLLYHLYPLEGELQVARRRRIKICPSEVGDGIFKHPL